MRILAIDLGLKRVGLAWTDPARLVALPLEVVPAHALRERLRGLAPEVTTFVLGYPRRLNGRPTEMTSHVEGLARWLRATFPDKEVALVDERLTSVEAAYWVRQTRHRQDKGAYDVASAVIILQAYLLQQKR